MTDESMSEIDTYKTSIQEQRSQLVDDLSQRDFFVFAGTGVSEGSDVKLWPAILKELNDNRPREEQDINLVDWDPYDYPEAAQILYGRYHRNGQTTKYYDIIKEQVRAHRWPFCFLQYEIIEVSGRIVTTNYDKTFEDAFQSKQKTNTCQCLPDLACENVDKNNSTTYLHGNLFVGQTNEIIFKTEDYAKYYTAQNDREESCVESLLSHLYQKTNEAIVFVGFSFDDRYILDALKRIYKKVENEHMAKLISDSGFRPYLSRIKHYALMPHKVPELQTYTPDWKINDENRIQKEQDLFEKEKEQNKELQELNIIAIRYTKDKHIELKSIFDDISRNRKTRKKANDALTNPGSPNKD
jgi:hypothetical protein